MKKIATALLSCALADATLAGCSANAAQVPQESQEPHTAAELAQRLNISEEDGVS